MFNTKKINELTEQLHKLASQHIQLKDRFDTYQERIKPEPKFKMFDEVRGTYFSGYGYRSFHSINFTGRVIKIVYDTDRVAYKYTVLQEHGAELTCYENRLELVEHHKTTKAKEELV